MMEGRVEVITSVQRRRRWSPAEKERIVAAALVPGANAAYRIVSFQQKTLGRQKAKRSE
jgi:transposase-like protein